MTEKWLGMVVRFGVFAAALLCLACESGPGNGKQAKQAPAQAVSVGEVRLENLEAHRTFSGSLASPQRFLVASKTVGRVDALLVDLGDLIENDQTLLRLEQAEPQQSVRSAEAERDLAGANRREAQNQLVFAEREMARTTSLFEKGIVTESRVDEKRTALLARQAERDTAAAQLTSAEAKLEQARIQLGYTEIRAQWRQGQRRVIAERHVQEGDLVAVNQPLYSLVALDPIVAVVAVTEKDYARIRVGQQVWLETDAYPRQRFEGQVARIAPVFDPSSRQARVELDVANPEQLLKPGMFVRAQIVVARAQQVTTVPLEALVNRNGETGVFVVNPNGDRVAWQPVEVGIRSGQRVEVRAEGLDGRVVTLGQQLIGDGSAVVIPESDARAEAGSL